MHPNTTYISTVIDVTECVLIRLLFFLFHLYFALTIPTIPTITSITIISVLLLGQFGQLSSNLLGGVGSGNGSGVLQPQLEPASINSVLCECVRWLDS